MDKAKLNKEFQNLIRKTFNKCFDKNYINKQSYNKIAYKTLKESYLKLGLGFTYWQFLADLSAYIIKNPDIMDEWSEDEIRQVYILINKLYNNIDIANNFMDNFLEMIKFVKPVKD